MLDLVFDLYITFSCYTYIYIYIVELDNICVLDEVEVSMWNYINIISVRFEFTCHKTNESNQTHIHSK